jgi:hypothetical protein
LDGFAAVKVEMMEVDSKEKARVLGGDEEAHREECCSESVSLDKKNKKMRNTWYREKNKTMLPPAA